MSQTPYLRAIAALAALIFALSLGSSDNGPVQAQAAPAPTPAAPAAVVAPPPGPPPLLPPQRLRPLRQPPLQRLRASS